PRHHPVLVLGLGARGPVDLCREQGELPRRAGPPEEAGWHRALLDEDEGIAARGLHMALARHVGVGVVGPDRAAVVPVPRVVGLCALLLLLFALLLSAGGLAVG